MSTIFNSTDCTTTRKNTGFADCFADPKLIIGAFLVSSSFKLSGAELASKEAAITALRAAAADDNKGQRIFPIHRLKNPANSGGDKTTQEFSDGSIAVVREGILNWTFQFTNGGLCLQKALRSHNQNGGYFIFYDSEFTLFGWQKVAGEIWGVPANYIWTDPWMMNDGSNVTAYKINLAFGPRYVNEGVGYAKLDSTIEGIEGLEDVTLTEIAFDSDSGIAEVAALLDCGAVNMAELYGTELANPARWVAENGETGEDVTITAVSVIGGTDKRFQLTFDTADSDYPDSGVILISLAAPSVLDAAGVEGYESDAIELEVSASS
jgi:hypothetical protein